MSKTKVDQSPVHTDSSWETCIRNYEFASGAGIDEPEVVTNVQAMIQALHDALSVAVKDGKIRAKLSDSTFSLTPYHLYVYRKFPAVGAEIDLSLFGDTISLRTRTPYSSEVWSMQDSFWQVLSTLGESGDPTFETSQLPKNYNETLANKQLMKHSNSVVFSLVRNFILFEQSGESDCFGLSPLRISWPRSIPYSKFRPQLAASVRRLYQINYALFRSAYIKQNK